MRRTSRIALGTAQFGMRYGIANTSGQVSSDVVNKVLTLARQCGVNTLDTAMLYGESENVLGLQDLSGFSVITKLGEVPDDFIDVRSWVTQQVTDSLERLGLCALDGLLLHRPYQLLRPIGSQLYESLRLLRSQGLVRRIGVSIYSPEELELLCDTYHFDLVQAPLNILDRRLVLSGWLEKLERLGTAIHVRSVFMQGLLLMGANQRPKKFDRWKTLWERWDRWLVESQQSAVNACLNHALYKPQIEKIVVGVDSVEQLSTILQAIQAPAVFPPDDLHCNDIELLNPSFWKRL